MGLQPPATPEVESHSGNPDGAIAVLSANVGAMTKAVDTLIVDQRAVLENMSNHQAQIAVIEAEIARCPIKMNPSPLVTLGTRLTVVEQFKDQASKKWTRWEGVAIAVGQGLIIALMVYQLINGRGGP